MTGFNMPPGCSPRDISLDVAEEIYFAWLLKKRHKIWKSRGDTLWDYFHDWRLSNGTSVPVQDQLEISELLLGFEYPREQL